MNSRRRIFRLSVEGSFIRKYRKFNGFQTERLSSIVHNFGLCVKQLYLSSIELSNELVSTLNLMPNLEKICLLYIEDTGIADKDVKLNVHKLAELESMGSSESVLRVFNLLPSGVLRKIKLHQFESLSSSDGATKLFENQSNIKEIHLDKRFHQLVDFQLLKLTTLKLSDKVKLETTVKGQNEIVELCLLGGVENGDLKLISIELKALQDLKAVVDGTLSAEFDYFSKMKNLKKLDIGWYSEYQNIENVSESLSFLHQNSLVELKLHCCLPLTEAILVALGTSAPMLMNLHLHTNSPLNILNTVIRYFINLEVLEFENRFYDEDFDHFVYQDLLNQKLKKMTIKTRNRFKDFPKLVGCCKKLEEIDTSVVSDVQSLRDVLENQPSLKKLRLLIDSCSSNCFHQISREFIDTLETSGESLNHFQCVYESFEKGISLEMLQTSSVFCSQFSFIITKVCSDSIPLRSSILLMTNEIDEVKKLKLL